MRVKKARRRPGKPEFIPDAPRQAAPAGARLRAKLDEKPGFAQARKIPQEVQDAAAERKLTGGYKTSKGNLCKSCFCYKPANRACC